MSAPRISRLRIEHRPDTLGIGNAAPRLSWCTQNDTPGWMQAAYEVNVIAPDGTEHTSGVVESNDSVLVPWPAVALRSREDRTIRVRAFGRDGSETPWSEPLTVEAGLLDVGDWQAQFVGPAWDEDVESAQPCPYLRRTFTV
ncbi:MAG TPA: alpha-L-rhamnosidase, partial [Acidimicrobiia bacterium]|nr:alpha-L-rhamnosidase [Acidimicrobiia bacterium]